MENILDLIAFQLSSILFEEHDSMGLFFVSLQRELADIQHKQLTKSYLKFECL